MLCPSSRDRCFHSKIREIEHIWNFEDQQTHMNWRWSRAEWESWIVVIKVRCWVPTEVFHERIFQLLLIDMLRRTQYQRQLCGFRQVKRLHWCREHAMLLTWVIENVLGKEKWFRNAWKFVWVGRHACEKAKSVIKKRIETFEILCKSKSIFGIFYSNKAIIKRFLWFLGVFYDFLKSGKIFHHWQFDMPQKFYGRRNGKKKDGKRIKAWVIKACLKAEGEYFWTKSNLIIKAKR